MPFHFNSYCQFKLKYLILGFTLLFPQLALADSQNTKRMHNELDSLIEANSQITDFEPDYIFAAAQTNDSYLFTLPNNSSAAPYYSLARISGVNSTNFTYPYESG